MRFYFIGICGTAMGNTALLLREMGHTVFGSDTNVYPPMSDVLQAAGIDLFEGFDVERLRRMVPDRVVVGNAISRGNPEAEWLLANRSLPFISLPELLGREILPERISVVVAGTHGKTTTASLTAHLLNRAGCQPGWMIGGVPKDLPSGATLGKGAPFVIEGDEYDSAFFDKRSKFIHYCPRISLVNNLEFDHADIFRDLADVQRTFSHFFRIVPNNGWIVYNGDDANLRALLPVPWTRCLTAGFGEANDLRIERLADSGGRLSAALIWQGREWGRFTWELAGDFNLRNAAMASLGYALALDPFVDGVPDIAAIPFPSEALAAFSGVRRRQDIRLATERALIIEDFGHHPTAILGTIEALRTRYPDYHLAACFEPRSNTARTSVFQKDFANALAAADSVWLPPLQRGKQAPDAGSLDLDLLVADLAARRTYATACPSVDALRREVVANARRRADPTLLICFSNGSFDGLTAHLADDLNDESEPGKGSVLSPRLF